MKKNNTLYTSGLAILLGSLATLPANAASSHLTTQATPHISTPIVSSFQTYYAYKTPNKKGQNDYNLFGIYGYFGYKKHSLELGYDGQNSKAYSNGNPTDLTAVYTNYMVPKWQFKVGARASDISDSVNNTNVYILGTKYTHYNKWGYARWMLGADAFYADAQHNQARSVSGKTYNPNFTQISPYYGQYLTVPNHPYNAVYLELKVNYQDYDKNKNPGLDIKNSYTNVMAKASYITPKWSITGQAYGGESYNMLEKGGFVFNNDYNTYTSAAAVNISYAINKKVFIKPWVKYQSVKKTTNNAGNDLFTSGVILGFSF